MRVAKAFAEGSVNAIQAALEALTDVPGELGELFTDLWKKSNTWVENMIEVARETDVFQRTFKTIMTVLFMLTPNFWAEMKGMVEGFLIPEIVISIILALIGTLCAVAGAAGIAARVAGVVSKIRKAFTAAGAVGKVLTAFFGYIDEIFTLIAKLSKALRKKIDEVIEGGTNAYNRIVRRSRPAAGPVKFMKSDDDFLKFSDKRSDIDPNGKFDVVAHGNENVIEISPPNGQSRLVGPDEAADLIKNNPDYADGQNVRLLSCSTGKGEDCFAQKLADKLGVEVEAPDNNLFAWPDGTMGVGPKPNDLSGPSIRLSLGNNDDDGSLAS